MTSSESPAERRRREVAAAVANFQRGEREAAFRALFELFHRPLNRFFRRKGCAAEEARDLTQETFLRIYEGLDDFRGDSRFETWAYRIATTSYLKRRRSARAEKRSGEEISQSELPQESSALASRPAQLAGVLSQERRRELRRAVEGLPEQMRTALTLRIYRQLAYKEIAIVMRLSIQTVKAHLFQARRKLALELDHLAGAGEEP